MAAEDVEKNSCDDNNISSSSSSDVHGDDEILLLKMSQHVSSAWKGLKRSWAVATVLLFFILLTAAAFISWLDLSAMIGFPSDHKIFDSTKVPIPPSIQKRPHRTQTPSIQYPLNCSNQTLSRTCKATNYPSTRQANQSSTESCPDYFRWIYEDLQPWTASGISRETLESAKELSHFRMVIFQGKAYLEKYHGAFQTRDLFTIWSFVQLVRKYPGMLPDLELMFRLEDRPAVTKQHYKDKTPPVLFQYCAHDDAVGVVYPDWSFWGWVEVDIKPWKLMLENIVEGANKTKWEERVPYAYWKGNQYTSHNRQDLMKCNVSHKHDWNARLYQQDWVKESQGGYSHSHLEDQCDHRYKIYVEGVGWSVSDKYILACDAMTLLVTPQYSDFFLRSLVPLQHYWPINPHNLCRDIKYAVDWGNKNPKKAKAIGKEGSDFMHENLNMEYVYAYMFHLLGEYAKLLKFKPTIPPTAVELCSESVACFEDGLRKTFLEESMVMFPSDTLPCNMPPPYTEKELQALLERKKDITKQVEHWVNKG